MTNYFLFTWRIILIGNGNSLLLDMNFFFFLFKKKKATGLSFLSKVGGLHISLPHLKVAEAKYGICWLYTLGTPKDHVGFSGDSNALCMLASFSLGADGLLVALPAWPKKKNPPLVLLNQIFRRNLFGLDHMLIAGDRGVGCPLYPHRAYPCSEGCMGHDEGEKGKVSKWKEGWKANRTHKYVLVGLPVLKWQPCVWADMGLEEKNMAVPVVFTTWLPPSDNRWTLRWWAKVQCFSNLVLFKYPSSWEQWTWDCGCGSKRK